MALKSTMRIWEGEPLLLIHGNGGSIESMGNQIDYFKTKYRVVADNRGQGKSELKTDS
jgi:pimeloyl-ACP methyl ester carboxylesterase